MNTTIRGIYDNGKVVLYEKPLLNTPIEVLVTFPREVATAPEKAEENPFRRSGYAKDYILYVAPDFDDSIDDLFDVFKE